MRYVRKTDIVSTEMDGDLVMMDITQGSYFGMNAVGKAIWHLLEQPQGEQELVEQLLQKFDVDEARCRVEANEFIRTLAEHNLIDIV